MDPNEKSLSSPTITSRSRSLEEDPFHDIEDLDESSPKVKIQQTQTMTELLRAPSQAGFTEFEFSPSTRFLPPKKIKFAKKDRSTSYVKDIENVKLDFEMKKKKKD